MRTGDFDAVELLYEDVPDTLSQLIRTAFIPRDGVQFLVVDFSAIESRVIAWFVGETWRQEVFARGPCSPQNFGFLLSERLLAFLGLWAFISPEGGQDSCE